MIARSRSIRPAPGSGSSSSRPSTTSRSPPRATALAASMPNWSSAKGKFVDQLTWIKAMYDEGLFVHKSKDVGQTDQRRLRQRRLPDHLVLGRRPRHLRPSRPSKASTGTSPCCRCCDGIERTNSLVGGASLWTLKGKSAEEYKGAAAFYDFLATPEAGRVVVDRHRLHPGDQFGLRGHEGQRLLRRRSLQGPRTGHRKPDRHPADREHPRHPPGQLRLDPRRNGQDHAGRAVQQVPAQAGARRASMPRATKSCAASKPPTPAQQLP